MITAKVIRKSQNDAWLNHDLEYGKTYEVVDIDMGQSFTSIYLKDMRNIQTGVLRPYNSVIFEFYEDGMPLDIYRDTRFNSYIWGGKRAMTKEDIKDALQACSAINSPCVNCPYKDVENCYNTLNNDARELITEQEKEIERLRTTLGQCNTELNSALESLKSQCREIGELKAGTKQAKIDVLKRLKVFSEPYPNSWGIYVIDVYHIDELIKEIEEQ